MGVVKHSIEIEEVCLMKAFELEIENWVYINLEHVQFLFKGWGYKYIWAYILYNVKKVWSKAV